MSSTKVLNMSSAQAKNNNVFDLNKARSSAKKKKARELHSNHQPVQLGIVNQMFKNIAKAYRSFKSLFKLK